MNEYGEEEEFDYRVIEGHALEEYGPATADDFNDDEPEEVVEFWER